MNLRKLIGRERASGYFYRRAADMAATGNVLGALQEVQRGLAYVNTSELNLLGAILCKRLTRWEDMRHYVAAIPADDPLRGEGEWLLRSNQARQRPPPQPPRGKAPVAIPVIPDSDALPVVMEEVAPSAAQRKPHNHKKRSAMAWLTLAALLMVAGGWFVWQSGALDNVDLPAADQVAGPPEDPVGAELGRTAVPEEGAPDGEAARQDVLSQPQTPVAQPVPPSDTVAAEDLAGGAAAGDSAPVLLLPTPTINANLAQTEPISQAIASTSSDLVVAATDLTRLDWQQWLAQKSRGDLASLPVTMRVEGQTLIFEGTVEYAEQRAALEFEAKQVPGVQEVSVVNVKVRPPQTYTVLEGDSLWAISVRIYGNADQVEELYAANRNQMTSAGDLRVGMVLAVPALE
jgi:nucleoid-associated protein YgaU